MFMCNTRNLPVNFKLLHIMNSCSAKNLSSVSSGQPLIHEILGVNLQILKLVNLLSPKINMKF